MLCKSTLLAAILLAVVCCLIQGVLASGYEALCVAALENDALNESTTNCCDADLDTSVPLYVTCANMSDGQLKAFTKCCPIIVHVDSGTEDRHKGKNDKRSIGRRNNKRRDRNQ